jgi:hypothetical protein
VLDATDGEIKIVGSEGSDNFKKINCRERRDGEVILWLEHPIPQE